MQATKMSRESRKVFQAIDALCCRYGVQGEVNPGHIYMCDMLMVRFYAQPVINMIKSKVARVKNMETKHFTFEYWVPVLINILRNNQSAIRGNAIVPDWDTVDGDRPVNSFAYITGNYLLVDYGYDDMVMLQRIVNTYMYDEIVYACMIGSGNRVYEIRYINAVLEKERAKKQVEMKKIDDLEVRIGSSNRILNVEVHTHTPLDLVGMQYKWEQRRRNAELERKMEEVLNDEYTGRHD